MPVISQEQAVSVPMLVTHYSYPAAFWSLTFKSGMHGSKPSDLHSPSANCQLLVIHLRANVGSDH